MNFEINASSSIPIFRQIYEQVCRLIASGQLRAGDSLPSLRSTSMLHAVNPMTVSKAYSMLENEGFLSRLRGVGMVVAERRTTRKDKLVILKPTLTNAVQIAMQLQLSNEEIHNLLQTCLDEWRNENRGQ